MCQVIVRRYAGMEEGRWGAGEAVTSDVTVTSSVTMSHSHACTFTTRISSQLFRDT